MELNTSNSMHQIKTLSVLENVSLVTRRKRFTRKELMPVFLGNG
jgi:hypothetical protein